MFEILEFDCLGFGTLDVWILDDWMFGAPQERGRQWLYMLFSGCKFPSPTLHSPLLKGSTGPHRGQAGAGAGPSSCLSVSVSESVLVS